MQLADTKTPSHCYEKQGIVQLPLNSGIILVGGDDLQELNWGNPSKQKFPIIGLTNSSAWPTKIRKDHLLVPLKRMN